MIKNVMMAMIKIFDSVYHILSNLGELRFHQSFWAFVEELFEN